MLVAGMFGVVVMEGAAVVVIRMDVFGELSDFSDVERLDVVKTVGAVGADVVEGFTDVDGHFTWFPRNSFKLNDLIFMISMSSSDSFILLPSTSRMP